MKKSEEARLEMFERTFFMLNENKTSFEGIPVLLTKTAELKENIDSIKVNAGIMVNSVAGITDAKSKSMETMILTAVNVAAGIFAYAKDNGEKEAEAISDIGEYELKRMRQTEIPIRVKSISDKAEELGEKLKTYGVSAAQIKELKDSLESYISKNNAKGGGYVDKSAAREAISTAFKNVTEILEVVDKLMVRFEENEPDLFNKYRSARNVIEKAGRKRTEEEPETGVQTAEVTVVEDANI